MIYDICGKIYVRSMFKFISLIADHWKILPNWRIWRHPHCVQTSTRSGKINENHIMLV